ncbi:hypothetical protein T439DRAFT_326087 [Meredithblackwellia eburnea MCA 4105]
MSDPPKSPLFTRRPSFIRRVHSAGSQPRALKTAVSTSSEPGETPEWLASLRSPTSGGWFSSTRTPEDPLTWFKKHWGDVQKSLALTLLKTFSAENLDIKTRIEDYHYDLEFPKAEISVDARGRPLLTVETPLFQPEMGHDICGLELALVQDPRNRQIEFDVDASGKSFQYKLKLSTGWDKQIKIYNAQNKWVNQPPRSTWHLYGRKAPVKGWLRGPSSSPLSEDDFLAVMRFKAETPADPDVHLTTTNVISDQNTPSRGTTTRRIALQRRNSARPKGTNLHPVLESDEEHIRHYRGPLSCSIGVITPGSWRRYKVRRDAIWAGRWKL